MIKELEAVEFPHAALVTEYKLNVQKLPVPIQAKVKNLDKAIKALTDESTEEEINEVLNESTLVAGLLVKEVIEKKSPDEKKPAEEIIEESKEEVEEVIEAITNDDEDEEEEKKDDDVPPPPPSDDEKKAAKIKAIVETCNSKGSITVDELKKHGMKKFAESIELDKDHTIVKQGEVYVLKKAENKEDKDGGVVGTILAAVAGVGIVFGLGWLFGRKK